MSGRRSRGLKRNALAILAVAAVAACSRSPQISTLRYLPGFVPGSENVYQTRTIEVIPLDSKDQPDTIVAGAVYDQDGKAIESVVVRGVDTAATAGIRRALVDAGLAVAAETAVTGTPTADFALSSHLVSVKVRKQFGPEQTVHGQYFTMDAAVAISFELRDRADKVVFSKEIVGEEREPPKPVGHEVFFPLETDPVEALSVAMSRAIGGLIVDPGFSALMPARPRPQSPPAS